MLVLFRLSFYWFVTINTSYLLGMSYFAIVRVLVCPISFKIVILIPKVNFPRCYAF